MNENTNEPNFEGEEMKMPENTDAQPEAKRESSVVNGPLLLVLTLLLVLILGGMYYWFATLTTNEIQTPERPIAEQNNEPESTTAEAQTETMQAVSTSDEISAIEADIEATNLDSLDSELNAIDAELEAGLNE
jgi:uncharacterized protein HemX